MLFFFFFFFSFSSSSSSSSYSYSSFFFCHTYNSPASNRDNTNLPTTDAGDERRLPFLPSFLPSFG